MDLTQTLADSYVFRGLPVETLQRLADKATIKDYMGGDQLVRQFDRGQDVYVILEGKALSRTFSGETVANFVAGDLIGEVALLDGEPRSTNVVAVHGCKAAVIPAGAIREFMNSDPAIGYIVATNIAKVLAKRIRSMNEQLDSLPSPRR